MNKLIETLQLLSKYENPELPFVCEHQELFVWVTPTNFSSDELKTLQELGFYAHDEMDCFHSFKYA